MSGVRTLKAAAGKLALVIVVPVLVVALLEGLVSLVLAGRDFSGWRDRTVKEERHSRYDAELGWVSVPNVAIPNMYGPGVALHTNARGFRGRQDGDGPQPSSSRTSGESRDQYPYIAATTSGSDSVASATSRVPSEGCTGDAPVTGTGRTGSSAARCC